MLVLKQHKRLNIFTVTETYWNKFDWMLDDIKSEKISSKIFPLLIK